MKVTRYTYDNFSAKEVQPIKEPAAFDAVCDGRKHVIEQMTNIRSLLDKHIIAAQNDKTNWAYSGDYEFISSKLSEIEAALDYLK